MGLKSKEKIEITTNNLVEKLKLGLDQVGEPTAVVEGADSNPKTYYMMARNFRKVIIHEGRALDFILTSREIESIQQALCDAAEASENELHVCLRVASIDGGIELDVGDKEQTRIRLSHGKVRLIKEGSDVLFYRPPSMQPFMMPAEEGNLELLFSYLNFDENHAWLLIIWICFTLSTPRSSHASYPILVLIAEQGASKSTTCKLIIRSLLDPSQMGIQGFPSNRQDIVLSARQAHFLTYDNLRYLSKKWSDILCIASTGGNDPTRRLYTDSEMVNHPFHVPLVLNGIHDFVEEPDLAQRCLRLELKSIPENKRRDEKEFTDEFNADLQNIFKGVLDLTASILEKLPTAEVIHPERMLRFVRYLAAAEAVMDFEAGKLQSVYSGILNDTQRDSMLSNPVALAVYELVTDKGNKYEWSGTPTELLDKLNNSMSLSGYRDRSFPANPIALSKQLSALKAPLLSQNIEVLFTRGKERRISILNLDVY
tara:strand:+ start:116 stop:1567 length:1452 start_codon:yes stop_codon:yes gene_type:complete